MLRGEEYGTTSARRALPTKNHIWLGSAMCIETPQSTGLFPFPINIRGVRPRGLNERLRLRSSNLFTDSKRINWMWLTNLNRILTGKAFEKRQRAAALHDLSDFQ